MILITEKHILIALLATLILMFFHYVAPLLKKYLSDKSRAFTSFTGGMAVSYVFLDMLPNLVEYNKPIGEYLIAHQALTPFTEVSIYIAALFGFVIYYGIEIHAIKDQENGKGYNQIIYNLHLAMFCLYNFLITYTMGLRAQLSIAGTLLFTLAMAFHFIITDKKFSRLYPYKFTHTGRFILMLFLFIGWICTIIFDPVNVLFAAFMLAFLAGSILLNVFREELPDAKAVNFHAFTLGVLLISLLSLLQIYMLKSVT